MLAINNWLHVSIDNTMKKKNVAKTFHSEIQSKFQNDTLNVTFKF